MDRQIVENSEENYQRLEKLGEGTYGNNNEIIALKKIRIENQEEGIPSTALREISIIKELNHPNIIKIRNIIYQENSLEIVFDYVDQDLKQYMQMQECKVIKPSAVKIIMYQLLSGINHCHNNRILHRDIKPQNILINNNLEIKIADFGLARSYTLPIKTYTHEIVTLWYRSPEVLLGLKEYSTFVDVWSIGALFYELSHNKIMFQGDSEIDQIFKIFKVMGTPGHQTDLECYFQLEDFKPKFPKWSRMNLDSLCLNLDADGIDLLGQLLNMDWNQRITCEQALQHKYFDGVRQQMMLMQLSVSDD